MGKRISVLITLATITLGCTSIYDNVMVTPAPGVENIPTKIAIYPLLTSENVAVIAYPDKRVIFHSAKTRVSDERLYVVAPAESKLVSNIHSQLLTSRLSSELSRKGFSLKELPIEVPSEYFDREEDSFFVSLKTLRQLREEYDLEAILIGNVYFVMDQRDRSLVDVRAVYLRLVDTATLNVLCHVSIDDMYQGESIKVTAEVLASSLAKEAGFSSEDSR